jgi:nitrate/nitrite-specific signal transduction histidine kinase
MKHPTLRRRLNLVLVQWFGLLVLAAGGVLVFSAWGGRQDVVEQRLLLARTIAHSFDDTISGALQALGRLATDLPVRDPDAAQRLRAFRFQSPFRAATYLLDERGGIIAADPPGASPIPSSSLGQRETVTGLVVKPGAESHPVVAIVQPVRQDGRDYYLVSEMSPPGSVLAGFLQHLAQDPDTHLALVDAGGAVIAAADAGQQARVLPRAATYGERIRAHRPWVTDEGACDFAADGHAVASALTVMVPLQFAPWGVVVQQHSAKAFAGIRATQRGLVLAGLMLAGMGLLLSRALSRSIVAPIQDLSRQAETMRAGDLSREIRVAGDEEIELLASTLDEARRRLAGTLADLRVLNEDLEGQVASRTRDIEARYRDLKLLHAVARQSIEERDPDRLVPEILELVAAHYGFPAMALVTRPLEGPRARYVVPSGASLPWLEKDEPPPADWQRREIAHHGHSEGELFHPRAAGLDPDVLGALAHQLALSLHSAYLWTRTVAQDQQRQVLVRRLLSATEDERRRLARELHDETAQLLTVIQLSLERMQADTPEMARAQGLLARTQKEIHRIIHDLRPSLLDDLGLAAAMRVYAEEHLGRQGLEVSLEIDEDRPPRPEIEITVFRIYQELVTNIVRHAGAEHVSVELYERDGRLVLAVEDDGQGFDPDAKVDGAGITGMRERAALVNGTIRFDSEAGMGTHAVLEIPVR